MSNLKKNNVKKKIILLTILVVVSICKAFSQSNKPINWKKMTILVYTKNGKGYIHDNIPDAIDCIKNMGEKHGFKVLTSDSASVFTHENLQKFTLIVFANTNNDVFDTDAQRLAFRQYIEAGGGMVGIHSIMGTERNWSWFKQLIGGTFSWHARFQKYRVRVIDKQHPSVFGLPDVWEKEDECYFVKEMYPGIHPILVQDVNSLNPADEKEKENIKLHKGSFGDFYPAAWYQFHDGGLCWITTLGHDKKDYKDALFIKHLFQGIRFVAQNVSKLDYSKAYANDRNSVLR
jgi:uncharacterized protein